MADDYAASIPKVSRLLSPADRPRWSVMIPTHNCSQYLRETLTSVLVQDLGQNHMQIEVVDDCSTEDDPEAVVRELGQGRVRFYRQQSNVGVTKNFNTCVSRSLGDLVHILHGDDLVEPGFYAEIDALAERFPEAAMIATRSSHIDEAGNVFGSSPCVARYGTCTRDASPLYYSNPLRTPSVVIRRRFYEQHGGFCERLVHVADWEMWARAAGKMGAVMSNSLLARYREFSGNETSRLCRTGENLRDSLRLAEILSRSNPDFCSDRFLLGIRSAAIDQIRRFRHMGDSKAVAANNRLYNDLGQTGLPYLWRLKEFVKSISVFLGATGGVKRKLFAISRFQKSERATDLGILQ